MSVRRVRRSWEYGCSFSQQPITCIAISCTPIACDGFITLGLWLSAGIRSRLSSLIWICAIQNNLLLAGTAHHPAIGSNVTAAALFNFQDAEILFSTCIGEDVGVLTTLNFEIVIFFVGLHRNSYFWLLKNTTDFSLYFLRGAHVKLFIWITSFFCCLILTSADLRWKTLKAPYLLASFFAVSKEPFDFEIFSSLFSFSILNLNIYHLFLMPIIRLSILDVKDLGAL